MVLENKVGIVSTICGRLLCTPGIVKEQKTLLTSQLCRARYNCDCARLTLGLTGLGMLVGVTGDWTALFLQTNDSYHGQ